MIRFKPASLFTRMFTFLSLLPVKVMVKLLSSRKALELLFHLEKQVYYLETAQAIRYEGGLHTKHRHIKYHDFFIKAVPPGSRVLDIGCGIGELTVDIARQVAQVRVTGIDIVKANIDYALFKNSAPNVEYVQGDATCDLPEHDFDIIILSNVLEHIEQRVAFLKGVRDKYGPQKILIRVPVFERDWRIPLQEELDIDYRLDGSHFIEYRYDQFMDEMKNAGLQVLSLRINWGELWAETAGCDE